MSKTLVRLFPLLCLCALLGAPGHSRENPLKVSIAFTGLPHGKVGEDVPVKATMRNSSDRTVAALKPGDGSESGWREPHVYYTAKKLRGKEWLDVPPRVIRRCGVYNPAWQKDVVSLAPGETLNLGSWLPGPEAYFNLTPGRYRFQLHYVYGAGGNARAGGAPSVPAALKGVPSFHLTSSFLEYTVLP